MKERISRARVIERVPATAALAGLGSPLSSNKRLTSPFCYLASTQKAIEVVQKAIDEDVKQNYQEAYKQYQNSLDYFMMAMKCSS